MSRFYTQDDLQVLTGRKTKSGQIEFLRRECIPFRINALGFPVVAISAVEGNKRQTQPEPEAWQPPANWCKAA